MSRYATLATVLLSGLNQFAEDGADDRTLCQFITDLLEQELYDQTIVERLAQVYTVDTDQAALIALVAEAQRAVRR